MHVSAVGEVDVFKFVLDVVEASLELVLGDL